MDSIKKITFTERDSFHEKERFSHKSMSLLKGTTSGKKNGFH